MYFMHDYFLVRFDAGFFDPLPVSFSISASLFFPLASARFRRAVLGVGLASSFFSSSIFSTFFRAGVFVFFVFVSFVVVVVVVAFLFFFVSVVFFTFKSFIFSMSFFSYPPSKSYSMPLSLIFFILSFSFFANRFNRFLSPPSSLFLLCCSAARLFHGTILNPLLSATFSPTPPLTPLNVSGCTSSGRISLTFKTWFPSK
mmetsp:Transcript_2202/g.6754  ORF Transcript_2202/g.6754 Transcript_2202/m.6754 type:complete len:200 (+) Transcript_2202:2288-2887(+)